jgi:hypothetical protein
MRVFSVAAEGVPVVSNHDLYTVSGGRFIADSDRIVVVPVSDGELTLTVNASSDYPLLSGIVVEQMN